MKKYKLIKEYPGSDHEGIIVSLKTPNGLYEGYQYNYSTKHVENNPEYWEEVVEKDYEVLIAKTVPYTILSVKRLSDGEVFTVGDTLEGICGRSQKIEKFYLNKENEMCVYTDITCRFSLGYLKTKQPEYEIISYVAKDNPKMITIKKRGGELHDSYWKIHSVKRLSDGEVFTVGDLIKTPYTDCIGIIGFDIKYSTEYFIEVSTGFTRLLNLEKAKQPIFLTHDGKNIYPENKVWYVNKENLYHDYIIAFPEVKFNSEIRAYFLTREEAEDYIVENKVLFITEDGVGIKKGGTYYFVDTNLKISLAPNASTGAGLYDERKYFSTYETALYYVIVNAKVLSIEEFWEFVCKPGSNVVKQKALKRLVKERLNLK